MHPIFSRRDWLVGYLAATGVGAALLAMLLGVAGALPWAKAGELAVPLALLYAFECLTPWYLCRMLPLGTTHPAKVRRGTCGIGGAGDWSVGGGGAGAGAGFRCE